jgi:hypothetical protein
LGCGDAFVQKKSFVEIPASDDGYAELNRFYINDLDAVIGMVKIWCDRSPPEHPLTFSLTYNWRGEYLGEICDWLDPLHDSTINADPCHALLSACVEAARQMKGTV